MNKASEGFRTSQNVSERLITFINIRSQFRTHKYAAEKHRTSASEPSEKIHNRSQLMCTTQNASKHPRTSENISKHPETFQNTWE